MAWIKVKIKLRGRILKIPTSSLANAKEVAPLALFFPKVS
jgi:hypothetical protein